MFTAEEFPPMFFCKDTTRIFDSREALKMRWYWRLLALRLLDRSLPLAGGTLPSQEPMAFYRLLLAGQSAVPGTSAADLLALLNAYRGRAGRPALALPPNEVPEPEPIGDGVGILLIPPEGAPEGKAAPLEWSRNRCLSCM